MLLLFLGLADLRFAQLDSAIHGTDLEVSLGELVVDQRIINVVEVFDFADDLVHVDAESSLVLGLAQPIQLVNHSQ